MYRVSVLVPIYGVEKYIERCARSLFEQTYENIEYIFVNDCTKDNSVKILCQVLTDYPKRKNDVKIIDHERNRGLAAARNTAVNVATGYYLTHVDADDWIDIKFVEKCVECQIASDADIITTDFRIHYKNRIVEQKETDATDPHIMLNDLLKSNIQGHIWGRLIKTSLYQENGISICEGANYGEDLLGMTFLLYYSKKHKHLNGLLYNYDCQNVNSYSNTFSSKSSAQSLENLDVARSFFQDNNHNYLPGIDYLEISKVVAHMIQCSRSGTEKNYYNIKLLSRLRNTNKQMWHKIKPRYRMVLFLKNYYLVRLYVLLFDNFKRFVNK